jgi:hypothetical protein
MSRNLKNNTSLNKNASLLKGKAALRNRSRQAPRTEVASSSISKTRQYSNANFSSISSNSADVNLKRVMSSTPNHDLIEDIPHVFAVENQMNLFDPAAN